MNKDAEVVNNEVVEGAEKVKKHPIKKALAWIGEHGIDFTCYAILAAAGGYTLWAFKKSKEVVNQQLEANRLQIESLELDNELKRKELNPEETPEIEVPEIDIPE